jgi:hypothetical protein
VAQKAPRLAAIEVFLLSGWPEGLSDEHLSQNRRWLGSYGIRDFDAYRSDRIFFQWAQTDSGFNSSSPHVVLVSQEKCLKTIQHPAAYGGESNAIVYHVRSELDDLMSVVVTLQMLQHTHETIQSLREKVFKRIGRRALGASGL